MKHKNTKCKRRRIWLIETDIRPMTDHLDWKVAHRDRDEKRKLIVVREKREKGSCWNSFTMMDGSKLEHALMEESRSKKIEK